MQILLHADAANDGRPAMTEHLHDVLGAALARFGDRVTRVQVQLGEAKASVRPGFTDIHCTLEARLAHEEAIIVTDHAGNAHQAIAGAVRKLKRAVGAAIAKRDPRQQRTPRVDAAGSAQPLGQAAAPDAPA